MACVATDFMRKINFFYTEQAAIAVRPAAAATCCNHAENANVHAVMYGLSRAST